jgi:hypothetical protein
MSTAGDAKNLLALKGQVTIKFVDGEILEGEFVTQDELNIFIKIDHEPVMIPRHQIRYIKGKPGQPVEKDSTLSALPGVSAGQPQTPVSLPPIPTAAQTVLTEEHVEQITIDKVKPVAPETADISPALEEGNEDTTLVLKQNQPQPEEEEVEETTLIITKEKEEAKTEEISAYLDCTTGPHAGEVFKLTKDTAILGRSSDNLLALSGDKEISRKHSKIVYESGSFIIEDQNSLNGTFVNDQRIDSPRYLEEGDVILIGVSTLVYHQK